MRGGSETSAGGEHPGLGPDSGDVFLVRLGTGSPVQDRDGSRRWSDCEALLAAAAGRPGPHRAEARWGLVLLLRLEGRFDEAKRWLEDGFDVMTDPVLTLQRLYKLDVDPFPTEGVAQALERAGRQSPEDDLVTGPGRAHLATRLGRFDEAKSWLDRCLAAA